MKFHKLVISIQDTHEELQRSAVKAVNQALTVRNWLIGLYIVEFEQKGEDRAKYGERLLPELSESIKIKGLSVTNLKLCRQFYTAYPHLLAAVKEVLNNNGMQVNRIGQTASDQFKNTEKQDVSIHQTASDELKHLLLPAEKLLANLSYSHLQELASITNLTKRTFLEIEAIKNAWGVRELKCHVLVELKVDEAKHEHIGQLKTYVNYYKMEIMQQDDNPPVGLLLVTNQNRALVEYAIADSDQQLFVSKYLLELPSEAELIAEIEREKNVLREQGVVYGMKE